MDIIIWVIVIVIAIIVLWLILTYNGLVTLRTRINNAWSQIDVQLKRRYDLIPNLVETVKGYAKHEKSVFENVTKARSALQQAEGPEAKAKADNMLSGTLKSLFAVSENYPDLKANQNFMQLQEELTGTESKIAYSRQFYNDNVMVFNEKILKFPTVMIAGMLNFTKQQYFKTEGVEREAVKVSFSDNSEAPKVTSAEEPAKAAEKPAPKAKK